MASTSNAFVMRFTANMSDLERELKRLTQINNRQAANMAAAHNRAAQQSANSWRNTNFGRIMSDQFSGIGGQLKGLAGIIAATFAGNEALQAAERWTTFSNSLRVAGLEGSNLKAVQEQLYQSAVKNGVELGPLGALYGRLSQSANELGASQSQMLQFTNGITAALRVQGGPAEAASGALMQLSQAMASGIVRAEEFNSINEGARPILEAVAAGWAKQGMTVAKLRAVMLDGKLTSSEFFAAFLNGSQMLEDKAAKAPLTVAQGMTNLHTALTRAIGQTNEAYGVTERLGQAIKWVADHLDVLGKSIMVVGGLYALTLAPAIGLAGKSLATLAITQTAAGIAAARLTVFNIGMTASMTGMSTAAVTGSMALGGLKAAMAFFGGPIGIAFLAISAAIAYIGVSSATAALETEKLDRSIAEYTKRREAAQAAESNARVESGQLSDKQRAALETTAALTGQVDLLSTAYGRLALEAKRARIEILATDVRQTSSDYFAKKRNREEIEGRTTRPARGESPQARAARENNPELVEARRQEKEALANGLYAAREYKKTKKTDAMQFAPPKPTPAVVKPTGPKKTGGGAKPRDNSSSSERAEEQADKAYHAALHASAKTAEERHKYALEALDEDKADKLDQLERQVHDKAITAAAAEKAKASYEAAYTLQVANVNYEREQELAAETAQQMQARLDLATEKARLEADAIDAQAQETTDLRVRHRLQREALAKRQGADDAAFKLQQDQLELDRRKAGWTEEVIKRLREDATANRTTQKANEQRTQDTDQKHEQPQGIKGQMIDFANGFGDINTQLSDIAKGGISDLSRGLADAIMNAGSLKDAFTDMAKSMIGQLIEMGIRFAIFEALGMALGVKGMGKASIGLGPVAKNAMGTDNFGGGLSIVGEKGPELVGMPRGSQVVPNNLFRRAFADGFGGGSSSNTNVTVNNTVHATDAVLTSWVSDEVNRGTVKAIAASQKLSQRTAQQTQQNSLFRR
jgi:tape measure domain-containing protein